MTVRPSSSGQDDALSRRKQGFDSPWAYHFPLFASDDPTALHRGFLRGIASTPTAPGSSVDRRHQALVCSAWCRPIGTIIGVLEIGSSTMREDMPNTSATTASVTTPAGRPSATIRPAFMAMM